MYSRRAHQLVKSMYTTHIVDANVSATEAAALPPMFGRYKNDMERELRTTVTIAQEDLEDRCASVPISGMLQYHMGWVNAEGESSLSPSSQGKALRPTLCLFVCEALSGEWSHALPAAAALELIHNFSLIHDDIQDGDVERRHRPTVWALWGQPQALIAGNAMRCLADYAALEITQREVSQDKALRASWLLTQGYLDMTKGQCLDLAFENSMDIGISDYLTMISCKTGALIRCGMEMGALVGSEDEQAIRAFAGCGSLLGLAFQIKDDALGIWGDEAATGKAVGNDIRRKKKSFPIVYALESAGKAARQRLTEVYSKSSLEDGDVDDVLTVLEEINAAAYAQNAMNSKADLALQKVSQVPMEPWARAELEELIEFLAARRY